MSPKRAHYPERMMASMRRVCRRIGRISTDRRRLDVRDTVGQALPMLPPAQTFAAHTCFLGRQVAPRRLLPTAILGAVALGAVTAEAPLYLPNVASASARSYGLVGFAFAFLTWPFVQALLIVGAAVAGAATGERLGRRDRD